MKSHCSNTPPDWDYSLSTIANIENGASLPHITSRSNNISKWISTIYILPDDVGSPHEVYSCFNCGWEAKNFIGDISELNYCPNCGFNMKGEIKK